MAPASALRLVAHNLLTAVLYLLLAQTCLTLATVGPHVAPLWLPAGFAFAALVWQGPRLVAGVWLGHAAANFLVAGAPWHAALLVGLGGGAAAWLGATICRRCLPDGLTDSPSAPLHFLAIAYGSAALGALYGPVVLWLYGEIPAGSLDASIVVWWLGDALGIVALAPAMLAWREADVRRLLRNLRLDVAAVIAATLALAAFTFFAGRFFLADAHLQAALLLPPMMWLTTRCHPVVPLSVNLAAVFGLVYGATDSLGPLLGATPLDRAYALHGFVLLSSVTLLFLAAHIQQVREMTADARAGEERFRRMTTLTSDWYWEQDTEFRFTFFDGPVLGEGDILPSMLLGKSRGELPGIEPYSISWEAHRADLDAHRTFVGLILRYVYPDGRLRYFSISGEPRFDDTGQFAGYRGVGRDVTGEIESREALQASERQFHAVADATFEGLFIHDFGRVAFANKSFADLVGRSIDDIVGRLVLEFVAPEEHQKIIQQLALNREVRHYETLGLHADGHSFPVEVFGRPIVFQGKPMRIAAIRDIAGRRAVEEALSAQIRFQHTLLDTIPNPVFYKDRYGRFLGYNRAFAEFFGIGARDYIGKTVLELVPGELGRKYKANDDDIFANPGIRADEEPVRGRHGLRQMIVYKDLFKDENGENGGMVGVLVDVTERKRIEDRLRRFQEMSPAAIGILDTNGKLLYINPAARELFGFALADVPTIDAWWRIAYPDPAYREDRRTAWLTAVEQTLREGRNMFRLDARMHCRDGRERWIETLAGLGEHEIFMIFTDLTDYMEGGKEQEPGSAKKL